MKTMSPDDKKKLVSSICSILEQDSRVVSVRAPDINLDFSVREIFYPDVRRTDRDALLMGKDAFSVMSLSNPILLHVHVPKKNQPLWHGSDDIPAEDYFVAWNGISAFVFWKQDDDHMPLPGGQVVADILRSALIASQAELYIQSCRPECDNVFFHTNVHLRPINDEDHGLGDQDKPSLAPRDDGNGINLFYPEDLDDFDLLTWLDAYLEISVSEFGRLKNLGRRIMDIESSIRDQVAHLLGHYYDHALVAARPWWRSLRERWQTRWWRREAREILAALWLSLANLEGLRRRWEDDRRDFEQGRSEYSSLFARDYSNEVANVESLEVSHLEATIEHVSSNLDNRAVVIATVGGALAGGLTGALLGALVGLIH